MQKKLVIRIAILVVLTFVVGVLNASAQKVRRPGQPTAPAVAAPAPDPKPAAANTATGTLKIDAKFPAVIEAGRHNPIELTITGGKPPYVWNAEDGWDNPREQEGAKATFGWNTPEDASGEVPFKFGVKDSSEPPLEGVLELKLNVTPRVVRLEDVEKAMLDTFNKVNGRIQDMQRQTASIDDNLTTVYNKAEAARLQSNVTLQSVNYMHTKFNWSILVLGLLLIANLVIGVLNMLNSRKKVATPSDDWTPRDDHSSHTRRVSPVVLLALGLGFASQAQAQTNAAPAKEPACAVRSITVSSPTSMVVPDDDPKNVARVTVTFRNCGKVTNLASEPGINFTEVKRGTNRITARVTADAGVAASAYGINLIDDKGEVIAQKETQEYLPVTDNNGAMQRRLAIAENNNLRKAVTANVTTTKMAVENMELKLQTKLDSKIDATQARSLIGEAMQPLFQRVADLETVVTQLGENDKFLLATQAALAGVVEEGMSEKVKKGGFLGFGGTKPLDSDAAEAAKRIREAVVARQQQQ